MLTTTATASAARPEASDAADPSAEGKRSRVAAPDRGAPCCAGAQLTLPGTDPAVGDLRVAVIVDEAIRLIDRVDLGVITEISARAWMPWPCPRNGSCTGPTATVAT